MPRIRYLRFFKGAGDFRSEERSASLVRWFFGEEEANFALLTPYSVAMDGYGTLWVADTGSRMLYRFDLTRGEITYIREFGEIQLISPGGVVVDNLRRRLFVSDAELAKVFVFDLEGRFLAEWAPAEGFGRPAGMAIDSSGHLFVADVLRRQVFVFDTNGALAERRGSRVGADGLFGRPLGVAIGPRDELLILDGGAFRIEAHGAKGELLGLIGKLGDVPGTFARPRGLAVSAQGQIFVSDAAFDNIQVFDLTGRLLMHFGSSGGGAGQFNLPAGLSFDQDGRLFVADAYNHRIQVFQFSPEGGQ